MNSRMFLAGLTVLLAASSICAQVPLWDENVGSLYSNLKAHRPGDIVTIIIQEQSVASSKAVTDTKVKSEASGGPGSGTLNFISLWGLSSENNYKGDAKTQRSGQLQAKISARIVEILPNGDYRLEGKREVNINGERERIRLSGVVRPRDIGPNNTVLSQYVADAEIMYDGKGHIDSGHEPGILTKILNWFF